MQEAPTVKASANAEDGYFVTADEARSAAENIASSYEVWGQYQQFKAENDTQQVFWGRQRLRALVPVNGNDGQASFYICNYVGGGFSLIAADRHMSPLLAFSEHGTFPTEGLQDFTQVSSGLITWMETTKAVVVALRANPSKENTAPGATGAWRQQTQPCEEIPVQPRSTSGGSTPLQTPTPCAPPPVTVKTKGPLLASVWGQGRRTPTSANSYNALCPATTNSAWYLNFRSPTGCVATAMAQIMYRWNRPTRYQWSTMLPGDATPAAAELMRDAGQSVSMSYGDESSSADTQDAVNALKNTFGYSSANWLSYSGNPGAFSVVVGNLNSNLPVIIRGNTDQSSFLWWSWSTGEGHAWVCDGYEEVTMPLGTWLSFHMNWGWDGQANGLFHYNNWTIHQANGSDLHFQYGQNAIVGIHP